MNDSPTPEQHVETVDHEHLDGLSLVNEVVITRHGDGLMEMTFDGATFPWFVAKEPGVQIIRPTEDIPVPIVMVPVLAASIEVRDAVTEPAEHASVDTDGTPCPCDCCNETCGTCCAPDALEGVVVAHPEDDATP